jgi:predicted GIY-YIG superfamily endonuclease
MSLLMHLREYRQLASVAEKIPLYCVFGDTVIKSIAEEKPQTREALQQIRGLTEEKREKYGDDILRLVSKARGERGEPPPPRVLVRHARRTSPLDPWTRRGALIKTFDVKERVNTGTRRIPGIPAGKEGVYVLELAQGRVYVGHSTDMRRRLQQHMTGQGSAFTKAFPPTGVLLPRLGCVTGSPEAAERDETLRYMFLRGIQLVRGWRYVRVEMPDAELQDAEENIRELFDLCRRCGHPGHFITQCRANFDRLGRPCKG